MLTSWRRAASRITLAFVVGGLAIGGVASAEAAGPQAQVVQIPGRQTPKPSCPSTILARSLAVTITAPRPDATVDSGASPQFDITGTFHGSLGATARRVELYAGGRPIGTARVNPRPARDGSRTWSFRTSAPPGTHTVLACVRTWGGVAAAAKVTFTVKAPAAGATVVSPDVVTPPAPVLSSITKMTGDSLTFSRAPGLKAGDVLVAGITNTTPDGLLRRVTSVGKQGSSTVVRTVPAGITDALLQADINLTAVPLTPAATATTFAKPGAREAISAPTLSANLAMKFKSGAATAEGKVTVTARATLDVSVKIDWNASWTSLPKPELKLFRWRVNGTLETSVTGKFRRQAGKGFRAAERDPEDPARRDPDQRGAADRHRARGEGRPQGEDGDRR
jgi:hypothetical protein